MNKTKVADYGPHATLGSAQYAVSAVTNKDITPPDGTKRILIKIVTSATASGTALAMRARAGTTGAASMTADFTTVVAPTSGYVDVVVGEPVPQVAGAAYAYIPEVVEIEMTTQATMTWLRLYASHACTVYITYFTGNLPLRNEIF